MTDPEINAQALRVALVTFGFAYLFIRYVVLVPQKPTVPDAARYAQLLATAQYLTSVEQQVSAIIVSGQRGQHLPSIDPRRFAYSPKAKERLVGALPNVSKVEIKPTGEYSVTSKVTQRFVSREVAPQITASGTLLVTTTALVFHSPHHSDRTEWSKVSGIEVLEDGFRISKRTGVPLRYVFSKPDAGFTVALMVMHSAT